MICNSTGSSNVQRKSCCVHPQGNIIDLCQLYQVRISPIDAWMLQRYENPALGHKRQHSCRRNFTLFSSCKMTFVFERLSVEEKTQKYIFCANFRSDQISTSAKNQSTTTIPLFPHYVLSFSE